MKPIIQTKARSSVTRHGDDKARSRQTVRLLWIRDKFIIMLRTESDYKRSLHPTIHILILERQRPQSSRLLISILMLMRVTSETEGWKMKNPSWQ